MSHETHLERPKPLRVGENPFATNTLKVRKPKIIREVQILNRDYPDTIRRDLEILHEDVASGNPIPMLDASYPGGDYDAWAVAHARQAGMAHPLTWHDVEWFFAETYLYRYLMQVTRWFENGRDPFAPKKREEMASSDLWRFLNHALNVQGSAAERLPLVLGYATWGNRADLSYAAAADRGAHTATDDDLLVDDRPRVAEYLLQNGTFRLEIVHIIADNAGTELVMDLVLADFLLANGMGQVVLHLKVHPTFVSDALPVDIWYTLDAMDARGGAPHVLSERLRHAWVERRLELTNHPFWNSSAFLWEMPKSLRRSFEGAGLVILKGDANYRRAIGDALWDVETDFSAITGFFPAPLLALRTMKSDPVVGISATTAAELDRVDPDWRTNGQRAVIQFKGI